MASIWRRQPGSGRVDHTSLVRNDATDPTALIAAEFWEAPSGPTYFGVLKSWTGSAWEPQLLKTYLSGAWQPKPLKRWTGSAWVLVNGTGVQDGLD